MPEECKQGLGGSMVRSSAAEVLERDLHACPSFQARTFLV